MTYSGFPSDTVVVTRPSADQLCELAAKKLPSLTINEYTFDSMQPLGVLAGLDVLKLQDSGALRTLSGVEALSGLQHLAISTPASWEGTSRRIEVESFKPLAALNRLERLFLNGVRPQDLDLTPIAGMRHLQELDISGVPEFTVEHYASLAAALPITDGRCLQPYNRLDGLGLCSKCKGKTVLLTGAPPRARKWLCPVCNDKKLAEHVATWQGFKKAAGSRRARPG